MRRHLELGFLIRIVAGRRPLDVPVGDVVRRVPGAKRGEESHLEQLVLFPPVHPGMEVQAPGAGPEDDALLQPRVAEATRDEEGRLQGPLLEDLDSGAPDVELVARVVLLDVPRVERPGDILVKLEDVAATVGVDHFPAGRVLHEGDKLALSINDRPEVGVLEDVPVRVLLDRQAGPRRRPPPLDDSVDGAADRDEIARLEDEDPLALFPVRAELARDLPAVGIEHVGLG